MMSVTVLSLVERSWQAARECSLDAQRHGIKIVHVIKGRVDRAILDLIASYPNIRLISVSRRWFWPAAWLVWVRLALSGGLRGVLVDNDRAARRLRAWWPGLAVWLVKAGQGDERYELWADQKPVSPVRWYQQLGLPCGSH